jgi:hypothetical protein
MDLRFMFEASTHYKGFLSFVDACNMHKKKAANQAAFVGKCRIKILIAVFYAGIKVNYIIVVSCNGDFKSTAFIDLIGIAAA